MIVKIRGVKRVKARGKLYFYHRKTGQRINAKPGSAAFAAEVARLDARHEAKHAPPGTYLALVERYKLSRKWENKKPLTKRDYDKVFNFMSIAPNADPHALTPEMTAEIRDKADRDHGFRFGRLCVQVNRMLFNWGRQYGLTPQANPWAGLEMPERPADLPDANPPWEPREVANVLARAPIGLARGLILAAMGFRAGDVVALRWAALQDGKITYRSGKTGVEGRATIPPILTAFFEGERPAETIATNAHGQPWKSPNTFTKARRELVEKLAGEGLCRSGLTTHGLKHTLGRAMEEGGADMLTMQAGLQHDSVQMAMHYSRRADRRGRSEAVAEALNSWLEAAILENAEENTGESD